MDIALEEGRVKGDSVASWLDSALEAGGGLLRLTPTWVPRSFLHPGCRLKLYPDGHDRLGAESLVGLRYFGPEVYGDNIP